MKYKCEKCGNEFDTADEALKHEADCSVDSVLNDRLDKIEKDIKDVMKAIETLSNEMNEIRNMIRSIDIYDTPPKIPLPNFPHPRPHFPQFWWGDSPEDQLNQPQCGKPKFGDSIISGDSYPTLNWTNQWGK